MDAKDIKFAKEFSFTLKLEEYLGGIENVQELTYSVVGDSLLLDLNNISVSCEIVGATKDVLKILNEYKGRSILRLDEINKNNNTLIVTLLGFYQRKNFKEFRIVVDEAIHPELRKRKIDLAKAVKWIRSQIVFNNKYIFAVGNDNKNTEIMLLGKDISVVIDFAKQTYLHIIKIRSNRGNINEGIISLISSNISIEDRITKDGILKAEFIDQYKEITKNTSELIKLWNVYNDLELAAIREEALDMGYLKYKGYKRNGLQLTFSMASGEYVQSEFLKDGMYYVAVASNGFDVQNPLDYMPQSVVTLGSDFDPGCVNTNEFRIIEEIQDNYKPIPESGYIVPSIYGSIIQRNRRKTAQNRILKAINELPGLNVLLQSGEVVGVKGAHRNAVSDNLEKFIFGKGSEIHFLDRQKQAIDVAVNTPDIALIQGPPGTGKTLVIRSIVQRINELENGQARILVTSTQHDAVDNVVRNMTYGGVPANRVSNRAKQNAGEEPIYQWIDEMVEACDNWLDEHNNCSKINGSEVLEALGDLKTTKEEVLDNSLDELYELLLKNNFSAELLSKISTLSSKLNSIKLNPPRNDNTLAVLLAKQKINPEEYIEGGRDALVSLERYLKYECDDIEFEIPVYWKKLKRMSTLSEELTSCLEKYSEDLQRLKRFVSSNESDKDIEAIIAEMNSLKDSIELEDIERNQNKPPEFDLYDIIWNFKHELSSTSNVERIVESYSQVNAATCQQSVNKYISNSMHGFDDSYDYVIIDEAARSNPLDLMIPMSLGKKIILVGDHKQLPHMVEKDIVDRVVQKTNDQGANEVLEESLFMRLFTKVKEADQKNGTNRTCVLNEQFRMHPDICSLINVFYKEEQLKSACSAEDKEHGLKLKDHLYLYNNKPLAWIDLTVEKGFSAESKGKSKSRKDEVDAIITELKKILILNTNYKVGIISFYLKQVKLLKEAIEKEFPDELHRIEVGTVDAFQGKEFDIVILSTVRSNGYTELKDRVGFLNNNNRLCVAFSRAKRLLLAVGDSNTVAYDGNNTYVEALYELMKICKAGETGYYECKTL